MYMDNTEQYRRQQYSIKKGIVFGAFGGFIAAVGFTGIMLFMPMIFSFPAGTFLHTLGTSIIGVKSDPVASGLAAFSVVLIQGIAVGIVFGIVTSKVNILHPSNKKRGVALGVATGLIAFLVLYLPVILTVYPQLLTHTLATFPPTELSPFSICNISPWYSWSSHFCIYRLWIFHGWNCHIGIFSLPF